jgi:hypothetical protein
MANSCLPRGGKNCSRWPRFPAATRPDGAFVVLGTQYHLLPNAMQFLTWPTQGSDTLRRARTESFPHSNIEG